MTAVDWSKLPTDLLNLISQRIDDEIDLIRFRSICSTWRSSSVPNHHRHISLFKFPLLKLPFLSEPNGIDTINGNNPPLCHLSKQNIYLIKQPQQQEERTLIHPWLIRVSQNIHGRTRFFHPLLNYAPLSCNRLVLDFNKLSVLPLGSNVFIWDYDIELENIAHNCSYMFPEKVVAVTCHGKNPLIVASLSSPQFPLLLKCGNENWKVIPDMLMMYYGDICLFNGRPYAVDEIGKTVMVGPDSSVHLVAEPLVGGGKKKLLVESDGDLLLAGVDAFPVRVDLFKLNEKEKKWVKLMSLGDRVLFLGMECSFSASFSDLYAGKGNRVIVSRDILSRLSRLGSHESCVLDLDQGRHSLLSNSFGYSSLFRLPLDWN